MKGAAVAGLVIVGLLVGAGAGYFIRGGNPQTPTSTITSSTTATASGTTTRTATTTYTTTIVTTSIQPKPNTSAPYATLLNSDHLRLELYLNTTSLTAGGGILVTMNLTNTESLTNRVTTTYPLGLRWPSAWPDACYGYYIIPIGIALFSGYVTNSNVTTLHSLNLTEPGVSIACPVIPNFDYYSFYPSSNVALLCSDGCGQSVTIESSWGLAGSWIGNGTVYTKFAAGQYTIVEGDEWGDLLFLYFTVS